MVQQPGGETDPSAPPNTKGKKDCCYKSTPLICLLGMHTDNNTLTFITNIKQAKKIPIGKRNYIFNLNLYIINLYAYIKKYSVLQIGNMHNKLLGMKFYYML